MPTFTIAGLQLELSNTDNLAICEEEIRGAKARYGWLDMIVLPELASLGTRLDRAERLGGPTERHYSRLARELGVWLLPGSLYELRRGRVFNTTPVIDPTGKVVARYRKMFPWCPYERGVTPGSEFVVFDVPRVGRFGVREGHDPVARSVQDERRTSDVLEWQRRQDGILRRVVFRACTSPGEWDHRPGRFAQHRFADGIVLRSEHRDPLWRLHESPHQKVRREPAEWPGCLAGEVCAVNTTDLANVQGVGVCVPQ